MAHDKRVYLTTSIAYVNGPPHIGFALELIYTDVMARYSRDAGFEVAFVTGTDEHGLKIARKAAELKKTPQAFADEMSLLFRDLLKRLAISNTDFIRTTEPRHRIAVEAFCRRVMERGKNDPAGPLIYKKTYSGLYCVGCESFKTEKDLVDGFCPDHQKKPEFVEDENYFLRLSAFRDRLKAYFEAHPQFVIPNARFNEARQLVEGGLEDMSITRSIKQLTWGISIPDDPSQVIYVWFDALVNYMTAVGFPGDEKMFERWWPHVVHVLGKDVNRFHAVLWPAMCMAAGIEPPHQLAVHGWIHAAGQKMSKSLGNVVDPNALIDLYGADALRYLLLRYIPFDGDGDYVEAAYLDRYHADLANSFGNLVQRTLSMVHKYCDGAVPAQTEDQFGFEEIWTKYRAAMEAWQFDRALQIVWGEAIDRANQYIDQTKPWTLAKEGKETELHQVLYHLLECLRHVAWMIRPFMPTTAESLLDQLGQLSGQTVQQVEPVASWGLMESGHRVKEPSALFPRIEIQK